MEETINRLEQLQKSGLEYLSQAPEMEMSKKWSPEKWSKKEILGHLIDSGINNLRRFTEIQFKKKPYKIKTYNQDKWVLANDYQNSKTEELITFWYATNDRIKRLMEQQSERTLNFKIELHNGDFSDLRFLMNDYVDHLEHHLNQIRK